MKSIVRQCLLKAIQAEAQSLQLEDFPKGAGQLVERQMIKPRARWGQQAVGFIVGISGVDDCARRRQ